METEKKKISGLSDIGLRRKNNEDAVYYDSNEFGTLLIVADGMGGHRKGEVASKMVIDSLAIPFHSFHRVFHTRRSRKFFKKYMKLANKSIYRMSLSGEEYREMGTTVVSALIGDVETTICSVGDSRCYIVDKEGILKQVTKDQTYVELLFESGKISKSEISTHPQKNLLINAVGINPDLANCEEFVLKNDSYRCIMLCSDGLYNMVSDEVIQKILNDSSLTSEGKTKELLKNALNNGGNDNIAVVLYEN